MTIISHGVQISIAGGGDKMVGVPSLGCFLLLSLFF